ncbi:hypothetical protein EV361DRAFT_871579 [Lentinula raphanica]|nr:hypothetical protein EV361DRAFT_871579 [Lentinula raphanica]
MFSQHWCILAWSYHFNSELYTTIFLLSYRGIVFMELPAFRHFTIICIIKLNGLYMYYINKFQLLLYDYLVTNFGNLLHLEQVLWSLKNFVAVLTQGIWKLSQRLKWILAIAIILILVEFTTVFVYAVQGSIQIKKFAQISAQSKNRYNHQ